MEDMWIPGLVPGTAIRAACSHGDPAVIALTGELDSCTAPVVERAVLAMLLRHRRPRVIVVDLAGVVFLSVAGIQALHAAVDQAATEHVTLRIAVGPHAHVRRALTLTRMAAVLDVYPDRNAALSAMCPRVFLAFAKSL